MDERQMIERRCESEGWTIDEWRDTEGGPVAAVGRAEVIEDDENAGLFAGDQGELTVEVVGSPRYGSQRVHVGFQADGYSGVAEVMDVGTVERL